MVASEVLKSVFNAGIVWNKMKNSNKNYEKTVTDIVNSSINILASGEEGRDTSSL